MPGSEKTSYGPQLPRFRGRVWHPLRTYARDAARWRLPSVTSQVLRESSGRLAGSPRGQLKASLSVDATRARLFGGAKALWPLSGVMIRSASGHSRCSAQALSMGQTTS